MVGKVIIGDASEMKEKSEPSKSNIGSATILALAIISAASSANAQQKQVDQFTADTGEKLTVYEDSDGFRVESADRVQGDRNYGTGYDLQDIREDFGAGTSFDS